MFQNTTMRVNGAWIKIYCVLCSKTYNTLHSCHNFPAGSRQAAGGASICEMSLLCYSWELPVDVDFRTNIMAYTHINPCVNYNHQMIR